MHPITPEIRDDFQQMVEAVGLGHVRICTKFVASAHFLLIIRRAENDDGDFLQIRMLFELFQDFPSILLGHVQVEENEFGKLPRRIALDIDAIKIAHKLDAVVYEMQLIFKAVLLKRCLQQKPVVGIVLSDQNKNILHVYFLRFLMVKIHPCDACL